MKKAELYKLMDLLDDVKKIDSIILLHEGLDDSLFMVSQYQAKKAKLIGELIDQLISPSIQSEQSFSLIQMILGKYYPSKNKDEMVYDREIDQLVAAI